MLLADNNNGAIRSLIESQACFKSDANRGGGGGGGLGGIPLVVGGRGIPLSGGTYGVRLLSGTRLTPGLLGDGGSGCRGVVRILWFALVLVAAAGRAIIITEIIRLNRILNALGNRQHTIQCK